MMTRRLVLALIVAATACGGRTPVFAEEIRAAGFEPAYSPEASRSSVLKGAPTASGPAIAPAHAPASYARPGEATTTPPAPRFHASLYTGTVGVVTRGERREFITARATVSGPLGVAGINAFARGELTGTQDGGGLDYRDPRTFRDVEVLGGLYRKVGALEATVVAGATYSAEGDTGRPIDARLFTLAALARYGLPEGGYVYIGGGHHGPVGGPAILAAAAVNIGGPAFTVVDFAFPLTRTVFLEKAWVLKVGASIRVKTLRF